MENMAELLRDGQVTVFAVSIERLEGNPSSITDSRDIICSYIDTQILAMTSRFMKMRTDEKAINVIKCDC